MGYSGLAPGQKENFGVRTASGRIFWEMVRIRSVTQPGFVSVFSRFAEENYGAASIGPRLTMDCASAGSTRRGFVSIFFRFGGRKLWSGSVEPSPAALIRAAFNFSNPGGKQKSQHPNGCWLFW